MNTGIVRSLAWLTAALLLGCTSPSQSEQTNQPDTTTTSATAAPDSVCFVQTINGLEQASLRMLIGHDGHVSGRLSYYYQGKDRNEGILHGTLQDTLIRAEYTFRSEGVESVREVIFKYKNDTVLEGTGNVTEQGNKQTFTDPAMVIFDAHAGFRATPCRAVP